MKSVLDFLHSQHIQIADDVSVKLFTILEEYKKAVRRLSLSTIIDDHEIQDKHFIDSLHAFPFLLGEQIIDIGSGAGFPGLPLAVVCPSKKFSLLESNAKKCIYLENLIWKVGLKNVNVINQRLENISGIFDTILIRAFHNLDTCYKYLFPLKKPGGRIILFKSKLSLKESLILTSLKHTRIDYFLHKEPRFLILIP